MLLTDICDAAKLNIDEVIDGELTKEEINYFHNEAKRIFSVFAPNVQPTLEVTNGHIGIDGIWEIAPAVELHETIIEACFFRSYVIGTWYTIHNYPSEPNDADVEWEEHPTQAHQVIPRIGAKMMQAMIPEAMMDEQRFPSTVILKQEKHLS